jgi:hypothetical protein
VSKVGESNSSANTSKDSIGAPSPSMQYPSVSPDPEQVAGTEKFSQSASSTQVSQCEELEVLGPESHETIPSRRAAKAARPKAFRGVKNHECRAGEMGFTLLSA